MLLEAVDFALEQQGVEVEDGVEPDELVGQHHQVHLADRDVDDTLVSEQLYFLADSHPVLVLYQRVP